MPQSLLICRIFVRVFLAAALDGEPKLDTAADSMCKKLQATCQAFQLQSQALGFNINSHRPSACSRFNPRPLLTRPSDPGPGPHARPVVTAPVSIYSGPGHPVRKSASWISDNFAIHYGWLWLTGYVPTSRPRLTQVQVITL